MDVIKASLGRNLHRLDHAIAHMDQQILKEGGACDSWMKRARLLIAYGRHEAASCDLDNVLRNDPACFEALWLHICLNNVSDGALRQQLELQVKNYSDPALFYAIARLYEHEADFDAAFEWYAKGARQKRRALDYQEADENDLLDAFLTVFDNNWLGKTRTGIGGSGPIFLVGEAGAGLNYVEQVIAAHPNVYSAGSLIDFDLAVHDLLPKTKEVMSDAEVLQAVATCDMRKLAEHYLLSSRNVRGEKPYYVDRQVRNIWYVPLIMKALPDARIIHVSRCAADTCLSAWRWLFTDLHPHSYDLGELARHYVRYRKVVEHCQKLFGAQMIDVSFEAILQEPEQEGRRILEVLGLAWEDAVSQVATLDAAALPTDTQQEPMISGDVGRWKIYEKHLASLLDELAKADMSPEG